MSLNSNALLDTIKEAVQDNSKDTRIATVTETSGNYLYLKFYGESEASQKPYKKIANLGTISSGDTVILTKINNSYIVTGRVL